MLQQHLKVAFIAAFFVSTAAWAKPPVAAVLENYRDIAERSYQAAYASAQNLNLMVAAFLSAPNKENLNAAKAAWKAARKDYSQTEGLRFGNWFVDDWESKVNAWPIDEGFLDYVESSYVASPTNPLAQHNLVSTPEVPIGRESYSASRINWNKLQYLHGASDHETNVALGYHAIEFFLWGQDLNRHGGGPGQRPVSDYLDSDACTSGSVNAPGFHCQRRREILQTLSNALEIELRIMSKKWTANNGSYGDRLVKGDPQNGLRRILFGITSLSGDELSVERMQVALLANAPEDEQDCFSDDTHNSLYYNGLSVANLYYGRLGEYYAPNSMAELAARTDPALAKQIDRAIDASMGALKAIQTAGVNGFPFDQLIAPSNNNGHAQIQTAIDALQNQAELFEKLGAKLGLGALNPKAARDAQ